MMEPTLNQELGSMLLQCAMGVAVLLVLSSVLGGGKEGAMAVVTVMSIVAIGYVGLWGFFKLGDQLFGHKEIR